MSTIRGEIGDLPKVSAKVGTKKAVGANIGKEIINIGKDGTTFIPNVSEAGWLSWTNTGGLPNPKPVNLKGGQGDKGEKGDKGDTGATGPQGSPGEPGARGEPGKDGQPGKTPVKGEDYFTEADKAEMVEAVKAQLIAEQWTFTFMDDTTVTKDVYVE